jgi:hypothetical protein
MVTRITGTLNKDRYTFWVITRSLLFGIKNVLDKSCRENRNTLYVQCTYIYIFFFKLCLLRNNMENYFTVRQYGACALPNGYLMHSHTFRICIVIAFPLQQCLHGRAPLLSFTYSTAVVITTFIQTVSSTVASSFSPLHPTTVGNQCSPCLKGEALTESTVRGGCCLDVSHAAC